MRLDVLLGEEVRDSMMRPCMSEDFSVGALPTAYIILDSRCLVGIDTRIEPSYVIQDCTKELKPLDCSVAVVKVFVNVPIRHRRSDRFTYFGKLLLELGYHSLLVFDGIGPEDDSDAGDPLTSRIFAIVGGKDGFPIKVVSHVGKDGDLRKQKMQGC